MPLRMLPTEKTFPKTLTRLPIWGLWKLEEVDGRLSKIPYSARYEGRASSSDSTTWSTFEEALHKLTSHPDDYEGLALFISKQYRLVFIDVDHCLIGDNSMPDERADDFCECFRDNYMELSVSLTGLHIIVMGEIPKSFKNSEKGVEFYNDVRFCALTGNSLDGCDEMSDQTDKLMEMYQKYKKPDPVKVVRTVSSNDQYVDKASVIEWLRADEKRSLLYEGNWEQAGFSSQSEADLSLCCYLAYRCDCSESAIDGIFRTSGLYRDKWDRSDYRSSTMRKACEGCPETYSEKKRRKEAEKNAFFSKW